ncbi:MAG: pitrilysin family protein [Polyangiales bacterium]
MSSKCRFSLALAAAAFVAIGCAHAAPVATPSMPAAKAPAANAATDTGKIDAPSLVGLPQAGEPKRLEPGRVFELQGSKVKVIGIVSKNLPIVHLRLVVRAGHAMGSIMNGDHKSRAGIASITAQVLKDGGAGRYTSSQLLDRVDALGTDIAIDVGLDRVVFGLSVTKDKLDAGIELLTTMVTKPRFDAREFDKLKARELDRVKQAQKGSGGWIARAALYRELFGEGHPYAEVDATEASLANIGLADAKAFYKKAYVAGNTFMVVAGDVDESDLGKRLSPSLNEFAAQAPPPLAFPVPTTPATPTTRPIGRRIVLGVKPGSKQADIFVGMLAIPRNDDRWPLLSLAVETLGGGMTSRLFVDVREKRSLAYSTGASFRELANGPSLVSLYAGTQSPLAPKSVSALLENLHALSVENPISNDEFAIAKTSLETSFVFRLETIGSVASLAIDKEILGLPGAEVYDYVARFRKTLHDADLEKVRALVGEQLKDDQVVISVAGDAKLAKPLSHFGAVRVVDPQNGFVTLEQLPAEAGVSLDVPQ